jgi:thiamine pyrophosphate-dependent acetolactate synthase large subunit-like protein
LNSTQSGADQLVDALSAHGVEVVFGLPGVHNLPLWKALSKSPIRLVTVRHEQAAAYAADGYARATGRVGVALTTTGPGAANTLGAVGEAWASRSPIVVLATDIPAALRRPGVYRGALHEMTDQGAMFAPLVKGVWKVQVPGECGAILSAALSQATVPAPRPVYVEVPTDYLSAEVERSTGFGIGPAQGLSPEPANAADVEAAVSVLQHAQHPLIWAGGGAVASGASNAVALLAERMAAPVITTYQARGLIGIDHPCAVGLPPHVKEVGDLWDEADVVVAVGSDFDGMMTQNWRMPAPPHLIVINVDPVDGSKSYPPEVVIASDAATGVVALADRLPQRPGADALRERLSGLRQRVFDQLVAEHPDEVAFLDVFDSVVPRDAVVVADMCIPGYWLAAFHPVSAPRKLEYPVGWGTLGFAFPAAVGAAVGSRTPVVSVSGDGGFLFSCGELAAISQENIPLTAVIVDDGGYGMLRFDQQHAGDMPFGVDLKTPDFVALANSFGIEAEHVDGLGKEFGDALGSAIEDPKPRVVVASASLTPPPTTSPRW